MSEVDYKKLSAKYKKRLITLTDSVMQCLAALDKEMIKPSTPERGKRIAKIATYLEMANDRALHYELDKSFKQISNMRKKWAEKWSNKK